MKTFLNRLALEAGKGKELCTPPHGQAFLVIGVATLVAIPKPISSSIFAIASIIDLRGRRVTVYL
jgi:hypothetical protein